MRRLRVVVDVRPLQSASAGRGIGVYARNLLTHLTALAPENEYILLQRRDRPVVQIGDARVLLVGALPGRLEAFNLLRDWLFLHREIAPVRPDVIHFLSPIEPRQFYDVHALNRISVATVYDITPIVCRRFIFRGLSALKWPLYRFLFRHLRVLRHVIAISEQTRGDLIDRFHLDPARVTTTLLALPEGSDPSLPAADEVRYPFDHALYIGELSPSKNPRLLAEVLSQLERVHGRRLDLVVVGRVTASSRRLAEAARLLGVEQRIHFTGFADDEVKRALLRSPFCRCVLFPSYYEGFGLPALEAMAHGVPLVASSAGALPEIVGDAGILLDPDDAPQWAASLCRILDDPDLAADLALRGRRRAATFSWEHTARGTLDVYHRVAGMATTKEGTLR